MSYLFWLSDAQMARLEPYFPKIAKAFLIGEAEADFAAFDKTGTLTTGTPRIAASAIGGDDAPAAKATKARPEFTRGRSLIAPTAIMPPAM